MQIASGHDGKLSNGCKLIGLSATWLFSSKHGVHWIARVDAMKTVSMIIGFVVTIIALALMARWLHYGELAEKPVYSALQSVELEHRGTVAGTTLLVRKEGLTLAGFSISSNGRVWVVLNRTRGEGRVFSLPEGGEAQVECQLVTALPAETDAKVMDSLKSRCRSERS